MQNALAVYTRKPSLNGRQLAEIAREHDIQLRFMALGGYIHSDPAEVQDKALASGSRGALLLIGAFESDSEMLAQFDRLIVLGDREPIATMLNSGKLPWCELYVGRFNYEKLVKRKPKDKPKIDGSVSKSQLTSLKASKTRYIIYNQSRRKNGGQLMTWLAETLATATGGIIADYQRPSR
jgi:hypothetical protein